MTGLLSSSSLVLVLVLENEIEDEGGSFILSVEKWSPSRTGVHFNHRDSEFPVGPGNRVKRPS